ncbi:hypothetical protein WL28_28505 [Burkholderia ubonensis]|uniref:hypothetical protein n=1 Tax=Burkholderia ubonensis TaxID=101571 RepID=UPI0007564271|nr:hypothetical protein [Burkholderia ubonensis]KWA78028.1 hypothetical protein WL28_28505 [Burkholderia ubonensis]
MDQSYGKISDNDVDQRKLEEMKTNYLSSLKNLIDEKPKIFIELMCEATLGIESDGDNPFLIKQDPSSIASAAHSTLDRDYIHGLARLVLDDVKGNKPIRNESGYTPFIDVISENFSFFPYLKSDEIVKDLDMLAIKINFFNEFADTLSSAIDMACLLVFEGVPLYRKQKVDGEFDRLSFDDPLFMYVYKKGEFFETGGITHVPDWVYMLHFKDSDLAAHQAFFAGAPQLLDSERDLRRSALRSSLGIAASDNSAANDYVSFKHQTKLLNAVDAVVKRYYGAQFDEGNPDTWAKQKDVVAWLKERFELSEREATAVDLVTRPDSARKR